MREAIVRSVPAHDAARAGLHGGLERRQRGGKSLDSRPFQLPVALQVPRPGCVRIEAARDDRVEQAKRRIATGFYDHQATREEIGRTLSETLI